MRAIKKIIALATGATMLGATIMGAMAADLADFPSPLLIKDTTFDADIVYGTNADPSDIMGLVDAVAAFSVIETESTVTSADEISAVGEAAKIETSTKKLTLGSTRDNLTEIKTAGLDDDDLPVVLADGTFVADDGAEYDYEQTIKFNDSVAFMHYSDSDFMDKEPALMVYRNKKLEFLDYTLDFTKDVEADYTTANNNEITDIEDQKLTILGKTYDITTAQNSSAINVKLELMGGAISDVLEQGQTKTYTLNGKDYEVEVTYIGGTTSKVKFKVNGEVTDAKQEGQTVKLSDGTTLGVKEILEEEAGEVTADQVEFYLGAEKLTLQDTTADILDAKDNVQLDDEEVDALYVDIDLTSVTGKIGIDKIILTWKPDDEIFVAKDHDVEFPGLRSFKISMEGFTTPTEESFKIQANGDDEIELSGVDLKSGTVSFSILGTNGAEFDVIGGEGSGEKLITSNATDAANIIFDTDTDEYFVVADSSAEESYLIEVTDIDDTNGVDFKDVASGTKYENKKNGTTFSIGDISVTINNAIETTNNFTLSRVATTTHFDRLYTKEGLTIYLPKETTGADATPLINLTTMPTSYILSIVEENRDETITAGVIQQISLGITSNKTEASIPTAQKANLSSTNYYEIGDTDEFIAYVASDLGTKILYDKDPTQDTVEIIYHGGESYGNIFVSETATEFTTAAGGTQKVLKKVTIPLAKSDDDVLAVDSGMTKKNYLLVGGPCANRATAKVLGSSTSWPGCAEGFKEGVGRLLLKEMNSKVSMVVAGYSAVDTTRATRVLKNYGDYTLSGDEVEVLGTTATPQTVRAVTS
ncbi:hypothetical protein KY342_02765 [Candidatus Woesearchaeota archaeon]|nr:hypothetical protein [Candidatus Woesearchaeota archaeon]